MLTSQIVEWLKPKSEAGKDRDGMSLPDKMSMWGRKSPREDFEAKRLESDPFWRVGYACFDPIESTGSSTHIKTVLNSKAYKWLLASLKKASSLQWGRSNVMIYQIRRELLKMSPKERSPTPEVGFWLPWRPLRDRLLQAQRNQVPVGSDSTWHMAYGKAYQSPSFPGVIALTSSSHDEIQATTVGEYFEQTWLDSGAQLLDWLDEVFDERNDVECFTATTIDGVRVEFSHAGLHLSVKATGSPFSVAQFAEQLAWIGTAVQPWTSGSPTHYEPSLSEICASTFSIKPSPVVSVFGSRLFQTDFWHRLQDQNASPVSAWGYPTACRPDSFPGLEVSSSILLALKLTIKVRHGSGRILLQGHRTTMELVKHRDGVYLWHVLDSPSCACSCQNRQSFGYDKERTIECLDIMGLALQRHIISNCEDAETSTDLQKCDDPMSSDGDEMSSVDLEHHTTSSFNPSVYSLVGLARTIPMDHNSTPDSFDSDLLSMSSFSEDDKLDPLDADSSLFPIIKTVSDHLLVAFRGSATGDSSPCDGGESSGGKSGTHGTATHTLVGNTNTPSGSSSKRNTVQRDDDEFDDDGIHKPPSKKGKQNEDPQQKLLACPF
ncbi:hypothetical protein QBC33DRAFT_213593 [Phialemonium atrogriseum]|uniref:Uncharacterized protein n=1 Tax=Phialemonium atrogriseum TaxID=1093897 RepID=A0AAJ0BSH9_9PEZI|nr:uncharacterized protein QBC33DRAFT_213593 [Phialemonium atrogriseum]KAK1763688.1 hypothetical protein QBC33DRAFT_213593 [Phialemonium atrogriseum]